MSRLRKLRGEPALLALLFALSVAPFVARPIHLDEPVFLETAMQITRHPLDFYGFEMNWTATVQPVHEFMMNPPLASYLLAAAAFFVGWSGTALHISFALVALSAVLGTYLLASRLCTRPMLAALALLWAPGFLVSSTLLMSDIVCVALWVWALIAWERGLRDGAGGFLLVAALLAGLAGLAEYFGIALLPLLALYALARTRRIGPWLPALLVPVALLVGFHFLSQHLYGTGLFVRAGDFSSLLVSENSTSSGPPERLLIGLSFLGGCAASTLFLAPSLLSRRGILVWAAVGSALVALAIVVFAPASIAVQVGLWSTVGIGVLALAIDDLRSERSPDSLLLVAWVIGTFVFAAFLYWSVNARSILPLLPASSILLARRLDRHLARGTAVERPFALAAGLAASALLALGVASADTALARSAQSAAHGFVRERIAAGERVWFLGHWGFQYYAEPLGAVPIDKHRSVLEQGDLVVVPLNNTHAWKLPPRFFKTELGVDLGVPSLISTMNMLSGAGFHSAEFGPLPFAFGPAQSEIYVQLRAKSTYRFAHAEAARPDF